MNTLNQTIETHQPSQPAAWGGVFAMSLGAFALIASEFMPVSLLTLIARDLHLSEGRAGQAISISGAFALLTSLLITSLARNIDRKALLMGLTALMVVSGTVVAFAPNELVFMGGRALIGIAIGGFWSMSAASAMRLVPGHQVPRALAVVNGGNALATVVAAPLGSFLGALVGWRWAFFCVVPVAALAWLWKWRALPAMEARPATRVGSVFKLLRQPVVATGMVSVSLFFMGQFALFTYLRPFLETVTQVSVRELSLVLLVVGVAGFAGTIVIGACLKHGVYASLLSIPTLMAMLALVLITQGHALMAVTVLLGFWGLLGTAAPVAWWTWLARNLPHDAEAGGGLMVAVVQLAIAVGATMGGVLFDRYGYQATFSLSAILLLASTGSAGLTARLGRRHSALPPSLSLD